MAAHGLGRPVHQLKGPATGDLEGVTPGSEA